MEEEAAVKRSSFQCSLKLKEQGKLANEDDGKRTRRGAEKEKGKEKEA